MAVVVAMVVVTAAACRYRSCCCCCCCCCCCWLLVLLVLDRYRCFVVAYIVECYCRLLLFAATEYDDALQSTTVDVIYIASTRDETGPGASGQVQDLQGHHQDDQEQLLDHF